MSIDDPTELTRIAMSTGDFPEDPKDFSKLANSGAKLLLWHGVNDDSMSYHEMLKGYDVIKSRFPNSNDWLRAIMIPGLWHCRGGSGPTNTDEAMLEAMAAWVEKGEAPESLVAGRFSEMQGLERTFKLCAEPKRAMLQNAGVDPKKAENWICRMLTTDAN